MHLLEEAHEVVAREGHREDFRGAHALADLDRLLRHGQADDRQVESRLAHFLRDGQAVDATLKQGVDDQDVRLVLADLVEHYPAVADNLQELDLRLRVEQAADVVRHLGHVLDQQKPDLRFGL